MADRICTTPGCERRMIYTTRGVCKRCYGRQRADEKPRKRAAPWTPDADRFEARLARGENDCWQWVGASSESRPGGGYYGYFSGVGRIRYYAHRWSYEYHRAPIPAGLEIDHLCRNTLCVNPWHLEPVTSLVNHRRMKAATSDYCRRGHEFTPENTLRVKTRPTHRICRECAHLRNRRARERRREAKST